MRRLMLSIMILPLTIPVLVLCPAQTQECEVGLPKLEDFPEAGDRCKDKRSLSPGVVTPDVVPTKTGRCVMRVMSGNMPLVPAPTRAVSLAIRKNCCGEYAWYTGNTFNERPWPVGQLKPNDFGLFEMYATFGNGGRIGTSES